MKRWLMLGVWAALAGRSHAGMTPLGEHVDLLWTWNSTEHEWEFRMVTDGGDFSLEEAFLSLSDKPYLATRPSQSGARVTQSSSPSLAFTGVPAGAPVWYALASNAGLGEAYPGLRNNQSAAVFGSYFETDSRLPQPQSLARPWLKSRISSVFHNGEELPKFSMWSGSASSPRVWMSAETAESERFFLFAAGEHNHLNWTFGDVGIYRIGMKASAFLGPGSTNPTGESEEVKVTFAVGPVACWQASVFSGPELEDAAVSGMAADPDGDGEVNLVEYAFGTDPKGGGGVLAPGLGKPVFGVEESGGEIFHVLNYPRRKALQLMRPLVYTAQFSEDLEVESWEQNGVETVTGFSGDESVLNGEWEKVEVRWQVPEGGEVGRGFGRVKVEFAGE